MIDELLARVRAGGPDAKEAARTLGLLIERASRPPHLDDDDIVMLLSPEYADRRLSPAERERAIDGLIEIAEDEPRPLPFVVWALGKSADKRVVPALISVLERTLDDPEHEGLAYQALTSMIPIGGPDAMQAVRTAADRGRGEVGETARSYLRIV
jgi:PBS lyase HEAT-like repeat-containing protein